MAEHGDDTDSSRAMFKDSVGWVVVGTTVVAVVVAVALAAMLGARLARPLREIGRAARQIAEGDYDARIPREGPEEIVSLSDSFNQMAAALEEQERMRREFIANAAHELRTPLTNLQGYLEALRDGVIDAGPGDVRVAAGTRPNGSSGCRARSTRWRRATRATSPAARRARPRGGDPVGGRPRPAGDAARGRSRARRSTCPTACRPAATRTSSPRSLGNLLQNAVRYTPAGGRVDVRAERRPGRRARLGHEHRRRHPGRRPAARLRALLPGREVARPGARRGRHRAGDRPPARRGGRRRASARSRATG